MDGRRRHGTYACTNNVVAASNSRLPKNRTDGDGSYADIPKMAIATGDADPFECLLLKAGVDASEIQFPSTSAARIHYYGFNGIDRDPGTAPAATTLTSDLATLKAYDVVLLPCEGFENNAHNADAAIAPRSWDSKNPAPQANGKRRADSNSHKCGSRSKAVGTPLIPFSAATSARSSSDDAARPTAIVYESVWDSVQRFWGAAGQLTQ